MERFDELCFDRAHAPSRIMSLLGQYLMRCAPRVRDNCAPTPSLSPPPSGPMAPTVFPTAFPTPPPNNAPPTPRPPVVHHCKGGMVWRECGCSAVATCAKPSPRCDTSCVARCECPDAKPLWDATGQGHSNKQDLPDHDSCIGVLRGVLLFSHREQRVERCSVAFHGGMHHRATLPS